MCYTSTMITQSRLKEILHYEPTTGVFKWLERENLQASSRLAGKRAGHVNQRGYREILIRPKHHRAGRLAWLYMTGNWPAEQVDHINRDRDDNRWGNLREADHTASMHNRSVFKNSTTGITGVTLRPEGTYRATITVDNKAKHLGTFPTIGEAAAAREAAEVLHWGCKRGE